ncbi:hypothetical protein [Deinococcus roseus]|uniref:Uncharacterized protein n=1 Tax=Deinococcus roseus TaxID=392414 RepID=A0ABQ2DIZ4_9DEIO|nr:hypothetical protein [Deinococcus roseus]GGJ59639.1 hypothetical protein GCM10008938_52250 [Deinococcus roseus]
MTISTALLLCCTNSLAAPSDLTAIQGIARKLGWQETACSQGVGDVCFSFPQDARSTILHWETQAMQSDILELSPHWTPLQEAYLNTYQFQGRSFIVKLTPEPTSQISFTWNSNAGFQDQWNTINAYFLSADFPHIRRDHTFFYTPPTPAVLLEDHPDVAQALLVDHMLEGKSHYYQLKNGDVDFRYLNMDFYDLLKTASELQKVQTLVLSSALYYGQTGLDNSVFWVDQNHRAYESLLPPDPQSEQNITLEPELMFTLPAAGQWPEQPRQAFHAQHEYAFELRDRVYLTDTASGESRTIEGVLNPQILDIVEPWKDEDRAKQPTLVLIGEGEDGFHEVSVWSCLEKCEKKQIFHLPFMAVPVDDAGGMVLKDRSSAKALVLSWDDERELVGQYISPLVVSGNMLNYGDFLIYPSRNQSLVAIEFHRDAIEEQYFSFVFTEGAQPLYITDRSAVVLRPDGTRQVMDFGPYNRPRQLEDIFHAKERMFPVLVNLCEKHVLSGDVCLDGRGLLKHFELEMAILKFQSGDLSEAGLAAEITNIHNLYMPEFR